MTQSPKMKVLIADDVQETRRNTRLMLANIEEVEVVAIVSNGTQAVQAAREHHPDIVCLDINMPEMDGLTAYREIIKVQPDIGCIILTAEKDTGTLRTAMNIGIQEYLIKPFTIDELEASVARVHQRVEQQRRKTVQDTKTRKERDEYLIQLAREYSKTHRTDDQAMQVLQQLVEDPECNPRWMQNLAMIYIVRQMWSDLKTLAELADLRTKNSK